MIFIKREHEIDKIIIFRRDKIKSCLKNYYIYRLKVRNANHYSSTIIHIYNFDPYNLSTFANWFIKVTIYLFKLIYLFTLYFLVFYIPFYILVILTHMIVYWLKYVKKYILILANYTIKIVSSKPSKWAQYWIFFDLIILLYTIYSTIIYTIHIYILPP